MLAPVTSGGELILQNDVRQRLLGRVSYREGDILCTEFGRNGCGLTVKLNGRPLPFRAYYFDIAPANPSTPSGPQCLHPRFLGGKASGIAFEAPGFSFTISNFAVGKNATQKAVAEAPDAFADARNFGDVDPSAKNHKDIVNCEFVIGNWH
jgi:hypothetical protein